MAWFHFMASKSLISCRRQLRLLLGMTQHLAHQNKRPSSSSAQPPLRDLLAEYFLTNTLSAQRLHILASSSAVSGAQGLEDLVAAGAHGSAPQNLAREDMFQKSMNKIIPLGLHGDGVPFAAKMRDSLEQLYWSLAADPAAPRILFTAIPKSAILGRKSWDSVLQVFAWSMQQLALGFCPKLGHTRQAWIKTN